MAQSDRDADEELARRARSGESAALDALVERSSRRLRAGIEARLGDRLRRRIAASDVLQEAHLAALRNIAEFEDRGPGSFDRWFREIVDNKLHDVVRRHVGAEKRSVRNEVTRRGALPTSGFPGPVPTPSAIAIGEEFKLAVARAMERLPESYREVLSQLREHAVSVEDVAERTGRSPAAVRKLYGRALSRLEELLGLDPPDGNGRRGPTR